MDEILFKNSFEFILVILGSIIGAICSSYLRKKGENQATKEDIQVLTNLVKSIEQKFAHETEILKAKLSLETQLQISLLNEERSVIINFQKLLRTMHVSLTSSVLLGYDKHNNEDLDKYTNKIENQYEELVDQEMLLLIYLDNEDGKITELINEIMEIIISQLFPLYNKYYFDLKNHNIIYNNQNDIVQRNLFDSNNITKVFFENVYQINNKLLPHLRELRECFKSYLKQKLKNPTI